MIDATKIKPHMPIVCSENGKFAVVDHLEGSNVIKVTKDDAGRHHYIPLSWVTSVDTKVHVDRTGDQAMREWWSSPPEALKSNEKSHATAKRPSKDAPAGAEAAPAERSSLPGERAEGEGMLAPAPGHDAPKAAALEGEGSYSAARRYDAGVARSVEKGDAEKLGEEAAKALDGAEGKELRKAEQAAKHGHAH